jgi:hypothetical protein
VFGRWCMDMTGAQTARQIGSECLLMPDTCLGRPIPGVLTVQGVVGLFTEK